MKRNFSVAAVCVLMLMAGNADAAKLTMPGSSCRAYVGSETSNISAWGITGLLNTGISYTSVVCPMERFGSVHTLAINIYHPDTRSTICIVSNSRQP